MKSKILKSHIDYLDPDDWDERPEFICKKCGYKLCICNAKSVLICTKKSKK